MAFLVFEGIDASGKSTLLNLLCEKFKQQGLAFVKTKEPGGTSIGKKIRGILLEKQHTSLDPLTETLLYYADRKQHIKEQIQPVLEKKLWLLSDRYWASTWAYQCGGREIDKQFVEKLKTTVCAGYEPDLWILMDVPVEVALNRLSAAKAKSLDRLEKESRFFYQKVRNHYRQLAQQSPSKWLILQAENPPEQLLKQLLSHLQDKGLLKFSEQN